MNRTRALIVSLAVATRRGRRGLRPATAPSRSAADARRDQDHAGRAAHRTARPLRGLAPQGARAEAARASGAVAEHGSAGRPRRCQSAALPPYASSTTARRRSSSSSTARRRRRRARGRARSTRTRVRGGRAPMTDTSHRLLRRRRRASSSSSSAGPPSPRSRGRRAKPDPRLAALAQREQRLRADAKLVQQVVDRRWPPTGLGA